MGKTFTVEEQILVDPGVYTAKVVGYMDKDEGQYGPTVTFQFEIMDDDVWDGEEVTGLCNSKRLTEYTKMYKWLTTMGFDLDVGGEIDLDDTIGSEVSITVEHKPVKSGTIASVVDINPIRRRKVKREDVVEDEEVEEKPKKSASSGKSSKSSKATKKATRTPPSGEIDDDDDDLDLDSLFDDDEDDD